MPDRKHLWRGIHDPEWVRSAVDVELFPIDLGAPMLQAALVLGNRDVGHAFPTYVTPRVYLEIVQVDAAGGDVVGTRLGATIGREVDLSSMTEIFDTRVLPGESVKLDYAMPRDSGASALVGRVRVDPDYHYRDVFDALLGSLRDPEALRRIAEAKRRISASSYTLAEIRRPLP